MFNLDKSLASAEIVVLPFDFLAACFSFSFVVFFCSASAASLNDLLTPSKNLVTCFSLFSDVLLRFFKRFAAFVAVTFPLVSKLFIKSVIAVLTAPSSPTNSFILSSVLLDAV